MIIGRALLWGFAGLLLGIAVVRVATVNATPHPAEIVITPAPQPPP